MSSKSNRRNPDETSSTRTSNSSTRSLASTSTISSSQSQSKHSDFNADDKKKLVADVIFFVLSQEKKRVPHKRSEILKAVGLSGLHRDLQEEVLGRAFRRIREVFGLEVKSSTKERNVYYLVNQLDNGFIQKSSLENASAGLLNSILTLIFMSGGVIKDDQLVLFLNKTGLNGEKPGGRAANVRALLESGGNVKQFIEKEFGAKQHYIEVKKVEGFDREHPALEYRWGERANLEVKKSDILRQICKAYKCKPSAFAEQYQQVKDEENIDMSDGEGADEPMEVDAEGEEATVNGHRVDDHNVNGQVVDIDDDDDEDDEDGEVDEDD